MTGTELTVYWRPGCGYCRRLQRSLSRAGVSYEAVDIWKDPEARAYVRSVANGNETVPTVRLAGEVMVNPAPGDLVDAIRLRAPERIAVEPGRRNYRFWRRSS